MHSNEWKCLFVYNFALLFFAYTQDCRGAQTHMKILTKQLETLNKFREINEMIREEANKRRESREKLKQSMQNILSQSLYKDSIKDIVNPLNPRQKLGKSKLILIKIKLIISLPPLSLLSSYKSSGQVKIEKCKFMDSKMKPLWLVFSNDDLGAQDIQIIYKNGDGKIFVKVYSSKLCESLKMCSQIYDRIC